MRILLSCSLLFVSLSLPWSPSTAAEKCRPPKTFAFQVDGEIRRDALGFTEGLEVKDGMIFESTGKFHGDSLINRIDPKTGHVSVLKRAKTYFGEGLTFFAGNLYQMTYRERRVFVFDKDMKPVKELYNPREGWGLTHDNSQLIASDGSNRLYFLSPGDFSTKRVLPVFDQSKPVKNLNELEFVEGAIWANVFGEWSIVRISPVTGCVEARADLEPLRALMSETDRRAIAANQNFVPNGIAYSPTSKRFALTGKNWPMLFTGPFVEVK